MVKYIFAVMAGLMSVVLSSCGDKKDEPVIPVETAPRTVLVYQAATNNLGDGRWDLADIKEMRQAVDNGDNGKGRLLVYNSRRNGTYLLEIKAGRIDTLKTYTSADLSVSSVRMQEVLSDTKKMAPADSYGLVLWSHGSGWLQDGISDPMDTPRRRSFGYEANGERMNITTLAAVLEPENLDFIYFDCCYMGSVETLYELRYCAPVIVASPSELPLAGMPYEKNVECFFAPTPAVALAARNTFEYYDAKSRDDRTCTMVVVETQYLNVLAEATKAIYAKAAETFPADFAPQRYEEKSVSTCYYFDFKQYVHAICTDAALLADFDRAFDRAVLYSAATPYLWDSVALTDANGLSTYILRDKDGASKKNYNTLSWYGDVVTALPLGEGTAAEK